MLYMRRLVVRILVFQTQGKYATL